MAWSSPRTYVAGEVVTAAIFNTDLRDNMLHLGTSHDHRGPGSHGSANIGALVSIVFQDAAGDPAQPGTLQANGTILKYHDGGSVVVLSHDAAAATASIRSLGAGATQAAAGDHSHVATNSEVGTGTHNFLTTFDIPPSQTLDIFTTSHNVTTAARIVAIGVVPFASGVDFTQEAWMLVNGTAGTRVTLASTGNSFVVMHSESVAGAGNYDVDLRIANTSGGTIKMEDPGLGIAGINGTL